MELVRPTPVRPVIVLRPEPGNAATCKEGTGLGLDCIGAPIFALNAVPWALPDPQRHAGLIVASANAVRLAGAGIAALRALPVHAVGDATAWAARSGGMSIAGVGQGSIQQLVEGLAPGHYLRLVGAAPVPVVPPEGVTIEPLAVYDARPLPLGRLAIAALQTRPVVVLLHSGEAARHFAAECARLDVPRTRVALACLAPRIGDAAGPGWERIEIAKFRDDKAVLALTRQMCQTL